MKNLTFLLSGVIIFFLTEACQGTHGKNYNDTTRVDTAGVSFIKNGIEGGLTEIKASGLAITNSNNQRVLSFAKMMIDDHTKADSVLMKIETDKGVGGNDTISAAHEQIINDLSKTSGRAFDKAYLTMMVADHENALELFSSGSKNTDADISKFATETLPAIKMHLDSAKLVLASLK